MKRLPITVRLTLVFAAVMACVLAATGLFLHLRLGAELDRTLEDGLRSRADDIATFFQRAGPPSSRSDVERLTEAEEHVAQILDDRGAALAGSPARLTKPLLEPAELARARAATVVVDRRLVPELDEHPLRLIATPVEARG
ncbi:MAG: hypothetical protein M3P39_00490, partial [Actinomycetota bacterium]|nr:hypothetical protein [Actinomycetota bacterium]